MRKFISQILLLIFCVTLLGCMTFTEKDYELQEAKYEKERKAQEQQAEDTLHIKW